MVEIKKAIEGAGELIEEIGRGTLDVLQKAQDLSDFRAGTRPSDVARPDVYMKKCQEAGTFQDEKTGRQVCSSLWAEDAHADFSTDFEFLARREEARALKVEKRVVVYKRPKNYILLIPKEVEIYEEIHSNARKVGIYIEHRSIPQREIEFRMKSSLEQIFDKVKPIGDAVKKIGDSIVASLNFFLSL